MHTRIQGNRYTWGPGVYLRQLYWSLTRARRTFRVPLCVFRKFHVSFWGCFRTGTACVGLQNHWNQLSGIDVEALAAHCQTANMIILI